MAKSSDDWTTLALLPIFHADLPPLLAWAHPHPEQVSFVHLHPVSAHVDKTAVWIGIDNDIAGADVPPTVGLVTAQHGKLEQIHFGAGHNIFSDGRAANFLWGDWFGGANFPRRETHQFQLALVVR